MMTKLGPNVIAATCVLQTNMNVFKKQIAIKHTGNT